MPIYCYICPNHGEHELFIHGFDRPQTHKCPECKAKSYSIISAPALIDIKRDWNEKANDYRRDPYTQAKAQLRNLDREEQERNGAKPMKITEEGIQVVAKQIHDSKTSKKKSIVEQQKTIQQKNKRLSIQ